MEILGVIPARGGSKGIPRKNLVELAGRPLLAYACETAIKARRLTRVLVSTDDPVIAETSLKYGVDAPFLRSAAASADDAPMREVLLEVLCELDARERYQPDIIVVLQPTSPLRKPSHIDDAVKLLIDTGCDTVVSVVPVPHAFSPVSLMREEAGRLYPWMTGDTILRRQDKPVLFARNGPVVLALRTEALKRAGFYDGDCRAYRMEPEDSVDIDSPLDLAFAEFLMQRRAHRDGRVCP